MTQQALSEANINIQHSKGFKHSARLFLPTYNSDRRFKIFVLTSNSKRPFYGRLTQAVNQNAYGFITIAVIYA